MDKQINQQIPLSNPDITETEIKSILDVLKTPSLSLGPKLPEFENLVAKYVGTKYAVAVNSGTSALHLIIRSLGISDGDEVITTPFSFIASANCILFERAKPVFVDINPQTLNIDVDKIEEKISSRTKAILAVDVFGFPADWENLKKISQKHNLKLIEDSCEALGAEYQKKKAGTFGEAACFAFYPNKQITTAEGGIIVSNDHNLVEMCKSMRNQGRELGEDWLQHQRLGYNYRLSDINCALGIAQMQRIEEILGKREKVANIYRQKLKNIKGICIPYNSPQIKRSWFVYVIILDDNYSIKQRDAILANLKARGIGCAGYFPPIHLQPFYVKSFDYKIGDYPITEYVAQRTIALPFYNNLIEEQIEYITENLKECLELALDPIIC